MKLYVWQGWNVLFLLHRLYLLSRNDLAFWTLCVHKVLFKLISKLALVNKLLVVQIFSDCLVTYLLELIEAFCKVGIHLSFLLLALSTEYSLLLARRDVNAILICRLQLAKKQ